MGVRGKATVRDFALQNIILSIMCSYVAEIYATYFFKEFDVEVQTTEIRQLNSVTLKLALCLCLGTNYNCFLDLMSQASSS